MSGNRRHLMMSWDRQYTLAGQRALARHMSILKELSAKPKKPRTMEVKTCSFNPGPKLLQFYFRVADSLVRYSFKELTQVMVNLGFEDEINKMNENIENDVKIADRNLGIEEGDDYFVKERKYFDGHLQEIKEDLAYFQEGLLKSPGEKAEIEMFIDYLKGEVEKIEYDYQVMK